jgi:hypothetical protein
MSRYGYGVRNSDPRVTRFKPYRLITTSRNTSTVEPYGNGDCAIGPRQNKIIVSFCFGTPHLEHTFEPPLKTFFKEGDHSWKPFWESSDNQNRGQNDLQNTSKMSIMITPIAIARISILIYLIHTVSYTPPHILMEFVETIFFTGL